MAGTCEHSCVSTSAASPAAADAPEPQDMVPSVDWIDFSEISNPLGTPPAFIQALREALAAGRLAYEPFHSPRKLRTMLSEQTGIPAESFLVGSAADDVIRTVARSLERCTVGVSVPCTVSHVQAMRDAGHQVVELKGPAGFVVPTPSGARRSGYSFDAVLLSNPGFPTSRLLPKPTLRAYMKACKWVVVDERSIDLTLGGESMVPYVKDHPNLFVVRSFAESYAMPGEPISYCVGNPEAIERMKQNLNGLSVPIFADVLGENSQVVEQHFEKTRELLDSEVPWMQCALDLVPGVSIFPAEANYVLCRFDPSPNLNLRASNADEVVDLLQRKGCLVRRLNGIPGLPDGRYFCVSVRTRKQNERLIATLLDVLLEK